MAKGKLGHLTSISVRGQYIQGSGWVGSDMGSALCSGRMVRCIWDSGIMGWLMVMESSVTHQVISTQVVGRTIESVAGVNGSVLTLPNRTSTLRLA